MKLAILFAVGGLLAGCDRPQALSLEPQPVHAPAVDALAADPMRLHALAVQCRQGEHDATFCTQVAQADLRRFLSGHAGSQEYRTLAELPPIPASFDEPMPPLETQP